MIFFILSAFIILIDRGVKLWIARTLEIGQALPFIPGILRITHVENTGAAFSMFSNMRWPLVIVSSVAVIVLMVVILLYRDGELGRLGASFMLGGAIGNLIDRAIVGSVTDMFEAEFIDFAIFNVADIFVTVGCVIFVLHLIYLMIKMRKQKEEPELTDEPVVPLTVRKPAAQAPAPVEAVRVSAPEPVQIPVTPVTQSPSVDNIAVRESNAPSPYNTGTPLIEQPEMTEQQIIMEYYMELGIDKSDL